MAKHSKPTRKRKAGPRVARDTVTKPKEWKARFDQAHRDGMAALKSGDTAALENAINREKRIIDEQGVAIKVANARSKSTRK